MTDAAAEGVAETATGSGLTEEVIGRLVDQARAEGVSLTRPGGLLGELTKRVLESALEGELDDHLGYAKQRCAAIVKLWENAWGRVRAVPGLRS